MSADKEAHAPEPRGRSWAERLTNGHADQREAVLQIMWADFLAVLVRNGTAAEAAVKTADYLVAAYAERRVSPAKPYFGVKKA